MDELKNEPIATPEPKKTKFHAFRYWADVIKWCITLIGVVVDYIKENPIPKKDGYTN